MNKNDWKLVYKRSPDEGYSHIFCETNILYTPYTNTDNSVLCMHWDSKSEYQKAQNRPLFTEELVDFWFNKEVENLTKFSNKKYCPEIYYINKEERKIFIEWTNEHCNEVVFDSNRNLDEECPDWQLQVKNIIKDILNEGHYKVSLYPHCFYIKEGQVKTFDWYATFDIQDCYLNYNKFIKGMAGENSAHRFIEATEGDDVNFRTFFMRGIEEHIKWPGSNHLREIFAEIQ